MAIKLTRTEADMLIDMLKRTVEEGIVFPERSGRVQFEAVGERRDDLFVINMSRKGIGDTGMSYQGRVKSSGIILLRLDVNPSGVHINASNGEKITGTHLHVYSEDYEMREAVPFDIENKDLYQLCYLFFERFNIIEQPLIVHQQTVL